LTWLRLFPVLLLLAGFALPRIAAAQDVADAWKSFQDKVDLTTPRALASDEGLVERFFTKLSFGP
jgi:hypothetical protein